jgi:phosphatidylserine decarboxylase
MRLARGSHGIVLGTLLLALVLLGADALRLAPLSWPGVVVLLFGLLFVVFFRDPERAIAEGVCSPADGVVSRIEETEDGGVQVAVFMNLHDVHVNRAPCDARVRSVTHHAGALKPAWHKDSDRNERVVWELETQHGPVRVTQIAGLLARRIVPYHEAGAELRKGQRIGIIRLGSRVDVALPPGMALRVKAGDRVRAGSTELARPAK